MGIFGNCMVLAPPGAEGIAGASPAGTGKGASTFTDDAVGAFFESSLAVSLRESAIGILAVPDSLLTHSVALNFRSSSACNFPRISTRCAPRFASTLTSGRVDPIASFERTRIAATLATPKRNCFIEGIPLEKLESDITQLVNATDPERRGSRFGKTFAEARRRKKKPAAAPETAITEAKSYTLKLTPVWCSEGRTMM